MTADATATRPQASVAHRRDLPLFQPVGTAIAPTPPAATARTARPRSNPRVGMRRKPVASDPVIPPSVFTASAPPESRPARVASPVSRKATGAELVCGARGGDERGASVRSAHAARHAEARCSAVTRRAELASGEGPRASYLREREMP